MAKISKLYASVIFELALNDNSLDETLEQTYFLRDLLNEPDCRRILLHPHITSHEKHNFFGEALEGRIHERLFGFLCLAVDKNREAFIVPSLTELIELIRQHQRKTTAKVVSAIELNENQLASLTKMLSEKLDKQVDIDLKVDPSVIGGMYVYVDGYFIDRLLINRLSEMTVSMKERCGA